MYWLCLLVRPAFPVPDDLTEDVPRIYNQALQANATIANTTIGSTLTRSCSTSFASESAPPFAPTS